ncbi:MAG: circularly permuted type 2 ATP-grasp protein [Sphingomonadales bacterium]
MASAIPVSLDHEVSARALLADYRSRVKKGDSALSDDNEWTAMLSEVAEAADGDLTSLRIRAERQAADIGTGYRTGNGAEDRRWPLSPLPLMIPEREWRGISDGIVQRANLMELLLADIYGAQRLVGNGLVPAALLNGSPNFLRPMVGLPPPGGHHLQVYAADLARGPKGDWRVLADHTRNPVGAGYALENRLALTRVLPGLQSRLHIERLAPFFADLRAGIAAACRRSDPRIALLTPGRLNPSYAEQAHLARYLGLLLVEGEDLATYDDKLYLRTIEGFKRVDALWRRIDARLLDPLAFDSHSRVGVAGLIDAFAAGNVVVANGPGAGVLEAAAFGAFLPRLSVRMTGEDLRLPNLATWWCGQDRERGEVLGALDRMVIAPAFPTPPRRLGSREPRLGSSFEGADRDALIADMQMRGVDYVGQEIVRLATLPSVGDDGTLVPRPYSLRVFAARDANGAWSVMPGGFVRIGADTDARAVVLGEGAYSTDAVVVAKRPVTPLTLLTADEEVAIRRNPGTLPSRVADNLFWLGRYLERAENILALVRGALGGSADVDSGATLGVATAGRLDAMIAASGAAPVGAPLGTAFGDTSQNASVTTVMNLARGIGAGSRERLSADVWRLLDKDLPDEGPLVTRAAALAERLAALAGLSAESMGRTASWRFLDLGRRLERAVGVCRLLKCFDVPDATADDLALLLDLSSSAISYRQRYPGNLSARAARDLIALDASNPRSLAFQVEAIGAHLAALPRLSDDGMAEAQQVEATALAATLATFRAENLDTHAVQGIENRLLTLNDTIARRFFLRGGEPLRAPGMTLA